ncbi:MAG: hypothetical protein ACFB51_07710 [Anaerolineae bacterium]
MSDLTMDLVRMAYEMGRAGDRVESRSMLIDILRSHPDFVPAWQAMVYVADSREEAIECLQRILYFDPTDEWAIDMLERAGVPVERPVQAEAAYYDEEPATEEEAGYETYYEEASTYYEEPDQPAADEYTYYQEEEPDYYADEGYSEADLYASLQDEPEPTAAGDSFEVAFDEPAYDPEIDDDAPPRRLERLPYTPVYVRPDPEEFELRVPRAVFMTDDAPAAQVAAPAPAPTAPAVPTSRREQGRSVNLVEPLLITFMLMIVLIMVIVAYRFVF